MLLLVMINIMATLKEIAEICGVSASTVSRAFDPSTPISDKTRNKIIKLAKEMNCSPNLFARGLKTDRTYTIGVHYTVD